MLQTKQIDNPEDAVTVLLEVSPLWNSKQIAATTRELVIIHNNVHNQTSTFLNSRNLLCTYQSGFGKRNFTDFCLFYDKILKDLVSIHFGEDKTKSILFASKFKRKTIKKLHIRYGMYKLNNILNSST